jgi:recombination protein RecR
MSPIERLTSLFERFPGIGPRQAQRFVFFLLKENPEYIDALSSLIRDVRSSVRECDRCFRFFARKNGETTCSICTDPSRDASLMLIVERDADIAPIERSKTYSGLYFVLGGTIPLLDQEHTARTRGPALKAKVEERLGEGLKEVILAFSVNPDGENTARYVEAQLSSFTESGKLAISILGRGLSTGSELEYADAETIKNALKNRTKPV